MQPCDTEEALSRGNNAKQGFTVHGNSLANVKIVNNAH